MPKKASRKSRKKPARRTDKIVLLSLIFAFPVGLFLMWSDRCRWPRVAKTCVSLTIATVLIVLLAPFTDPPTSEKSGVRIVSNVAATEEELLGPEPGEEFQKLEIYVPYDAMPNNIVADPTEPPPKIIVYCNDGGRYYHTEDCRYTKVSTPKVNLTAAVNAGFKPCPDCDAPKEPED